jgi:HPt (histidine-containing phosphotransfer) domain-containing protein
MASKFELCEGCMGSQGLNAIRGWAQAWLASASDGGAKACDAQSSKTAAAAGPASGPAVQGGLSSCFELEAALVRLCGDRVMFKRLLSQFALDLAEWEPRLLALREQADASALCQLAHAIKGAAASAGAERLRCAAQALEVDLRNGSTTPAGEPARACLQELRQALAALQDWHAAGQSFEPSPSASHPDSAGGERLGRSLS